MARSYILGGVSATGLATGKPYIKRIVRSNGAGGASVTRADGLTCVIVPGGDNQGAISFSTTAVDGNIQNTDGAGKDWGSAAGELLYVEFPATTRTFTVAIEDTETATANHQIRARVMLAAEGQRVNASSSSSAVYAAPVTNGNFIEIAGTDTATINARTKGVFIQIFAVNRGAGANDILVPASPPTILGPSGSHTGVITDAIVLLVTAVLDQENTSASAVDFSTTKIAASGVANSAKLTKIWGNVDGVG